jgi:hypothetical protein
MMKNYLSHILPFFFALDLIIPFLLAPTYKGYSHLTQVMSVLGNSKAPLHLIYNIGVGGADMDYMTLKEASEKWGVSSRQVNYYCVEGRIPGAVKMAGVWLIPKETDKPADRRYKKQVKNENENSVG